MLNFGLNKNQTKKYHISRDFINYEPFLSQFNEELFIVWTFENKLWIAEKCLFS